MNTKPRSSRLPAWTGAIIALVGLALLAWVLSSISDIHGKLATISPTLATAVLAILMVVLLAILIVGIRFMWVASRTGRKADAVASADSTKAANQSVDAARKQLDLVADEVARRALATELESIEGDLTGQRYTVVVFGTGSAGKTSVINALLGQDAGATDPAVGTTKAGTEHAYTIDGLSEGKLRLIDTPGLSEIGDGGIIREERARELAAQADLLLFVVDQDLRDIEFKPLSSLAQLGKRSILVFNKQDLYSDQDADAIANRLRARVDGLIAPADVVICAADPVAVTVREASGAESAQTPPKDVALLADRLADTLHDDGRDLLAGNVLLRAKRISEKARDRINEARRKAAGSIVTRFQWTTAGVMFVNPVPGLGPTGPPDWQNARFRHTTLRRGDVRSGNMTPPAGATRRTRLGIISTHHAPMPKGISPGQAGVLLSSTGFRGRAARMRFSGGTTNTPGTRRPD